MTIVRTRTPAGEAIVILPEAEFERLRGLAEDALDARTVDTSQASLEAGEEELLDEADLDALRSAPTPLAFWRARRAVSLGALARESGIPDQTIASLEVGSSKAEPIIYARLARVLKVSAEDIEPVA